MSPKATLPVEDNGGMTVDQIRLAIRENNEHLSEVWAIAMDEHTEKIDARFDLHEQKDALRIKEQELELKKRLDVQDEFIDNRMSAQDAKLDSILEIVKVNRSKGEEWHEADLAYRAGVQEWREGQEPKIAALVTSVTDVVTKQEDLNTRLNLVQWLVMFCKGISWTSDKAVTVAEKGKKIQTAVAAICSSLLFIWAFFRDNGILEAIKTGIHQHFQHH